MSHRYCAVAWAGVLLAMLSVRLIGQPLCDYTPAESHYAQLSVQGTYLWHSAPSLSHASSTHGGSFRALFASLFDSTEFAYTVDGNGSLTLSVGGPDLKLAGSGSAKRYVTGDVFGVGSVSAGYATGTGLALDLTGGLGVGRFRDVTPLARAIHVQNALLDLGVLLGPVTPDTLLSLARVFGQAGATLAEMLDLAQRLLEQSGLVQGGHLDVRALLTIQDVLSSTEGARLCGWEAAAQVGFSVAGSPTPTVSEALKLTVRSALVPGPVSQWLARVSWISGFRLLDRHAVDASISYGTRILGNWWAQVGYGFSRDRGWSAPGPFPVDRHHLTASLVSRITPALKLLLVFDLVFATGYEKPEETLTVQFNWDVF